MIVGTAGHIDHGKTSLVRALTGVDTDRLKEEKARGISIDLGFAYLPAPDGSVLGFVDVPGHEKFVHNMLAGATGIDFVLLVIAADDGVMPQTREHLAIVDLLGIARGIVALTKIDLVAPPQQAKVLADIARLLQGTSLEGAEVVAASTVTIGNGEWSKQPLDSSDSIVAGDVRIETLIARFRLRRGFIFLRLARTGPVRDTGAQLGIVGAPRVDHDHTLGSNDIFADILAVIAAAHLDDDHHLAKLAIDFHDVPLFFIDHQIAFHMVKDH